jgi:hypothetical protein
MGNSPDYSIMQGGAYGKLKTVGAAWKKTGKAGPFISISIGPKGQSQSYLMFKSKEGGNKPAYPSGPRQNPPMPQQPWKPPSRQTANPVPIDDDMGF